MGSPIGKPAGSSRTVTLAEPIQIAIAEPSMITVDLVLPKTTSLPEIGTTPEAGPEAGILPLLRKLHPAQLKLLLLIDPDQIKKIEAALVSSPQSTPAR